MKVAIGVVAALLLAGAARAQELWPGASYDAAVP